MYGLRIIVILVMVICIVPAFLEQVQKRHSKQIYVTAFDGNRYYVRDTERKQETADTLARLNLKVLSLLETLQSQTNQSNPHFLTRLVTKYNPQRLSEGKVDKRYSSYTVDKGKEVVLCMRTRDANDTIYSDNTLFFVVLHELAHVGSLGQHHDTEWKENFKWLCDQAAHLGFLDRNFKNLEYCGLHIDQM